jgi:flagellar motor switch protein FliN/FliY
VSTQTADLLDIAPEVLGELTAAGLLAAPGLRVDAAEPGAADLLPPGARAVGVDIEGGGHLVLAAGPALARQIQVGPPPADDLLEAGTAVLATVLDAIGAVAVGAPVECPPEAAVAEPGFRGIVARLHDDDGHAATIALVVPQPAAAPIGDAPAPHEFAPVPTPSTSTVPTGLEVLHEVALGVTAELGRTRMLVRDVLGLAPGSVIELDRAAGSPVDVLVNGSLIARGEVVVVDEEFGIRITEVVGYAEGPGRA